VPRQRRRQDKGFAERKLISSPESIVFNGHTYELINVCLQGSPVNSNREAACFMAKLGGGETKFMQKFAKSGGKN
jgi:hypothetical protein